LFWLVLVVALTLGWWRDHKHAEEVTAKQAQQLVEDNAQITEMKIGNITRDEAKPAPPQPDQRIDNMPIMHPPKDYQSMPNAGVGK